MSFSRVKPSGWGDHDRLNKKLLTALDGYISQALDTRAHQTADLNSDVTMTNGSMQFVSGSSLKVNDPTSITITDGYLKSGAELNFGSLGTNTIAITGDHTLSNTEYNNMSLIFTGLVSNFFTITFPAKTSMVYAIDNQCTGTDGYLLLKKSGSSTSIQVKNGQKNIIYSDPTDLLSASSIPVINVIDTKSVNYGGENTFNTQIGSSNSPSYQKLYNAGGTATSNVFFEARVGDIFQVILFGVISADNGAPAITPSLISNVGYGSYSTFNNENNFSLNQKLLSSEISRGSTGGLTNSDTGIATFTAITPGRHEFTILFASKSSPYNMYVYVAQMEVTQYRNS